MTLLVPFFFAHQPFRLRTPDARQAASAADPGVESAFFDEDRDRRALLDMADRCYRPAARLLRDLATRHAGRGKPFRLALGLSGTLLEQAARYAPDLLDLWKELGDTGGVEFTGETYYHSLAGLFDDARVEFREQVTRHRDAIWSHFGQTPTVFRNTEMLYNDAVATAVQDLGFAGMVTEGVDWLMAGWRSPDFVYQSPSGLPVLLRNYRLSDDIGTRFGDKSWEGHPLSAGKFAGWLAGDRCHPLTLLAMDLETVGGYWGSATGIFEFFHDLPEQTARYAHLEWATPSQALARVPVSGRIDVPAYSTISWADRERDTSAWLGNGMQQFCYGELKRMEPVIRAAGRPEFLDVWRKLQASDHLRCLSDKAAADGRTLGNVSECATTPADSFTRLHSAIYDLKRRAEQIA